MGEAVMEGKKRKRSKEEETVGIKGRQLKKRVTRKREEGKEKKKRTEQSQLDR